MRYDVNADGTPRTGDVFFDMTTAPGEDALDGIKVDVRGNLYVSGPAACGSSRPRASISARSTAPSIRTTSPGAATTAGRSI